MKKAIIKPIHYFFFWIVFSILSRALFLIYHYTSASSLTIPEILKTFWFGFQLDASFAAYICIIPFTGFFLESLFRTIQGTNFIKGYTLLLIFILSLLVIIDLELYRAWKFRLDSTPVQYLNTPAELLASVSAVPTLFLICIFLVFSGFCSFIFLRFVYPLLKKRSDQITPTPTRIITLFGLIVLIVPLRGCSWHFPLNQSNVYFSNKLFANHAAVNLPWNVMYSLNRSVYASENPYLFFPESKAKRFVADLYQSDSFTPDSSFSLLTTKKPNILFIILESYTAKLMGSLGGEPGVTPHLDSLAKESLLFTNIYASGDRSEKGLIALLSGYPVQPTTSIIKLPRKTEKLPHLNQTLKKQGYYTSYYHGGELAFANIKTYLLNAGYDRVISKSDFQVKDRNSKWGVHDHVLLNRWLLDLNKESRPFFSTLFTLSSHEPYEIPTDPRFPGSDETTLFKNSVFYTDQAVGNFIQKAKKEVWWQNTIVVLTADHGHRLPGDDAIQKPEKFHIPLLITGGAIKKYAYQKKEIIGSQTDIAATLLHQLGLPTDQFIWSKNLLSPKARPFAFYVFYDGFGLITPAGSVTYDNISKQIITRDPKVPYTQLNYGKAYLQLSFEDYLKK